MLSGRDVTYSRSGKVAGLIKKQRAPYPYNERNPAVFLREKPSGLEFVVCKVDKHGPQSPKQIKGQSIPGLLLAVCAKHVGIVDYVQ